MKTNLNGVKTYLEQFAKEIAWQAQKTGRDPLDLIDDPSTKRRFEIKLLIDNRGKEQVSRILQREDIQELQVEQNGSQVSFAEVTREKMAEITELMDELPNLIKKYENSMEKIKKTEIQGTQAKEKYAKQIEALKQVTAQQLRKAMNIRES